MVKNTAPLAQGVDAQNESSFNSEKHNELFTNLLKYQMEDEFYNQPDCLAHLWVTLKNNPFSSLDDLFLRTIEDYLINTITSDNYNYEWAHFPGIDDTDNIPDIDKAIKLFNVSDTYFTRYLSIKEIAQQIQVDFRDNFSRMKLLMLRLYMVDTEKYIEQGW